MKKIISAFLAIAICFTLFGTSASAAAEINIRRVYKNGYTLVTLMCSGYTVRYTLDGSAPDEHSRKYTAPIKVEKPLTLRAAAFRDGKRAAVLKKEIKVRLKTPKAKLVSSTDKKAVYRISAADGAKVYITDDGTKPTAKNHLASSSYGTFKITVRANTTVKLRAYQKGWESSKTLTLKVSGLSVPSNKKAPSLDDFAAEVLRLVNEERKKEGLSPLKADDKLSKAAMTRANELSKKFDHKRPDGRSCFSALDDAGISYRTAGENIASGYVSPKQVVKGWMNSPGHRANILSPGFKYLGVGICKASYGYYWSQFFVG